MRKYFRKLLLVLIARLDTLLVGTIFALLSPLLAYFATDDGISIRVNDIWEFNYEF